MNLRLTVPGLICLTWMYLPASAQFILPPDSLVNLIVDGDFQLPCIEEHVYLPYQFESGGHDNSPDMVVYQADSAGGRWYWDEMGCNKDRYFLPFLPLHYACCRMRQEPPVPPAYSGERYACLIREPLIDEALVYQLTTLILPGQPYRLFFAARGMSPFCPKPSVRVSASTSEPCRGLVNSLEHGATNPCRGKPAFRPVTLLLTDTLDQEWTTFEQFLLPPDTVKWIIFSAGPADTTNGLPYAGIDDIQVQLLPVPVEITAPASPQQTGDVQEWTLTFRNPYPLHIQRYPVVVYPDDKLALIDGPAPDSLAPDNGIHFHVDLPEGTFQNASVVSTSFTWRCLSDCPMRSQITFGQEPGGFRNPHVVIKQPDPSSMISIPGSIQSLTRAIEEGLLPPDSIRGQDIFIQSDFLADRPGYQLTDCVVHVRWGARIVIPEDGRLSLIRTEFQGCGQPWESIHILDGGDLYLEESLIRDAKTALKSQMGARLRMRGSQLDGMIMDLDVDSDPNLKPRNQKKK